MSLCTFPCSLITAAHYFTGPQSPVCIPELGLALGISVTLQCSTQCCHWLGLCFQMCSDWCESTWDEKG